MGRSITVLEAELNHSERMLRALQVAKAKGTTVPSRLLIKQGIIVWRDRMQLQLACWWRYSNFP